MVEHPSWIVSHYGLDGAREHWVPGNRRRGTEAKEKRAFQTREEAEAFIADRSHPQKPSFRGEMGAYQCSVCGAWHIGHGDAEARP